MALAFVLGLCLATVNILAQTLVQQESPAYIRGRVLAMQFTLSNLVGIPPMLALGGLADRIGIPRVMEIVGLGSGRDGARQHGDSPPAAQGRRALGRDAAGGGAGRRRMIEKKRVPLGELVSYLDEFLAIKNAKDWADNGLQVEGREDVGMLAFTVDSSLASIEDAVAAGADMLIAHHGLFWGKPLLIVGPHRRRVKALLDGGCSLYARPPAARPPPRGRQQRANWRGLLDLTVVGELGEAFGAPVGVVAEPERGLTLDELVARFRRAVGEPELVLPGGSSVIQAGRHHLGRRGQRGRGRGRGRLRHLYHGRNEPQRVSRCGRAWHQRHLRRTLRDRDGRAQRAGAPSRSAVRSAVDIHWSGQPASDLTLVITERYNLLG